MFYYRATPLIGHMARLKLRQALGRRDDLQDVAVHLRQGHKLRPSLAILSKGEAAQFDQRFDARAC